jgi:putative ABC transport system permease protein
MNLIQITGAVELGLVYGLVAVAVFLTFRVIDFPDLTVDGSFPLGAAVATSLIVGGMNPVLASLIAFFAGALAGFVTGYLNVKWNILELLSGILTMTALYSINLRIMGRPNIALLNEPTIFNYGPVLWMTLAIVLIFIVLLARFLRSEFGLAVRATGVNSRVSRAYGINVGSMKIFMLALSNAIVAFSGSLFAQAQGFADISMGSGTVIIGLASVIIGEVLFQNKSLLISLISCILGSILYRIAVALALNSNDIGLQASDLNLITAIIVAVTMVLPKLKKARRA